MLLPLGAGELLDGFAMGFSLELCVLGRWMGFACGIGEGRRRKQADG